MPRMLETIVRRCIALDHPRWSLDQITAALFEAAAGRGPYAVLFADMLSVLGG
ncbi:MAG TPA: hypothetical protein VLM91_08395 [Candidatus Methylomirabilis sp.]|nr:hypothetical protein [Candidatus Methylomirabilis sp.]